jgi:PRC-barrel domain
MASETFSKLIGQRVDDVNGDKLGTVRGFYFDNESRQPVWAIVGLAKIEAYAAVPMAGVTEGKRRLSIQHPVERVTSAPRLLMSRPLSPRKELELCRHYGVQLTRGAMAESWERRTCVYALGDTSDEGIVRAMQATQLPGGERRAGVKTGPPARAVGAA